MRGGLKGAIKLLTKSCLSVWKKAICFHLKNQEKMNRNLEMVAMLDHTRLKQIVHGRQIPIVVVNNAAKAGFILCVSTSSLYLTSPIYDECQTQPTKTLTLP